MLKFVQKLSDNTEKIVSVLISKINKSEKLLFEEMIEFCSFFKTCNFFLKIFVSSWINLSSWLWRNWAWWCNWCFLISAAWKASNKCCFSSEKIICFFSIFSQVLSNHTTFMIRKLKNSEHSFFKQTYSLYLLNLSEITQNFFCLA